MSINVLITAYSKYSAGCKELKQALLAEGAKSVRIVEGDTWASWTPSFRKNYIAKNKYNQFINWGCKTPLFSTFPPQYQDKIFNKHTLGLQNKLEFFQAMNVSYIPHYTVKPKIVADDIVANNSVWFGRKYLNSTNGNGIVKITKDNYQEYLKAGSNFLCPLYTKYIKKKDEYRVHFIYSKGKGTELFFQKKLLKKGTVTTSENYEIRNMSHGWIFSHIPAGAVPGHVKDVGDMLANHLVSKNKSKPLFGAIDLIHNVKSNAVYGLECNSAPGITGKTAKFYGEAFMQHMLVNEPIT